MINKEKKTIVELPNEVIIYLNDNLLFNKFGIVNLKVIKTKLKCELKDKKLKSLIQAHFGKEFRDEKIEFI